MSFIPELTSTVPQGDMECIYTELALYGSKNKCARTDNVFFFPYLSSAMVEVVPKKISDYQVSEEIHSKAGAKENIVMEIPDYTSV